MDGDYVHAFEEAVRKPVAVDGRTFIPTGWAESKPAIAAVSPLVVHTLTGFVDYIKANRDGLTLADLVVHVKDPGRVELRAKLEGDVVDFRRHTYLVATTDMVGRCGLTFGTYTDAEMFFIQLQTGFTAAGHRDALLTLVGSIRENFVRQTVDSGVSQEVRTSRGVAIVGNTPVPNPVTLAPYRTFREIVQPSSLFVLRLKEAQTGTVPMAALFEADGGGWKLEAVQAIADFLRPEVGDTLAIVA